MKLSYVLTQATEKLAAVGVDNPPLDARILVGHALGLDRAQLLSQSERVLGAEEYDHIDILIRRRIARESVARIIGKREFWSLPFGINEATLEPRPDSETLVDAVVQTVLADSAPHILDLGTGSGCLLLSILRELPDATGVGIDIAPRAIEAAQANAKRLRLNQRARFEVGNWLDYLDDSFDIIISNPPYIAHDEIEILEPEVRDFEPRRALDGGRDGLDIYRLLIPQLRSFLKPEGFVVFEVGQGQAQAVEAMLRQVGFTGLMQFRDLNGIARCVLAHVS